ncbi:DUF1707 SHOCT-like domain-containing protein [Pseudonocardia endophytica]|uniref:Uncharacterized protein DUF1707 n=1 Tax=Pseudonocardia endophytica TaxID=401976 RepID=A0A4R1I2Z7_PSEEN|nr:DUF1707 domain-containing protein [Pseudonocardia endophytica]TCK27690.1 uncharacterized protein DUF1707 [Pseudonocardia endophytica]
MGDEVDRNPSIRVSDAERSDTVERLKLAQQEGRLSLVEYDDRLQRAYSAVTRADLDTLTHDLPSVHRTELPAARQEREAVEKKEARADHIKQWRSWAGTSVLLTGIWAIICLAAGDLIFFWPMFPIGIWGLVLLTSTFDGSRDKGTKRDAIEE